MCMHSAHPQSAHASVCCVQAGAIAAVLHSRMVAAAVLFTLALNHKQMLLYYAPAFFATMLGWCFNPASFQRNERAATGSRLASGCFWQGCLRVAMLGVAVLATCAAVWAPFLLHRGLALQVPGRLLLPAHAARSPCSRHRLHHACHRLACCVRACEFIQQCLWRVCSATSC